MNIHLIPLAGYCFFQPFRPFELHGGGKIDLVILFFLVRIRNDFGTVANIRGLFL